MWSSWPSYQKLLLLSRISRNKKSEKKICTLRGVMESAHFSSMRKEAILFLHIQEKYTWQIIVRNSQLYLSKVN
jgi:hypothetical protein